MPSPERLLVELATLYLYGGIALWTAALPMPTAYRSAFSTGQPPK